MYKTYPDGSRILVDRKARRTARVGEIVALRMPTDHASGDPLPRPQPGHNLFIKRVVGVAGDPWPGDVPHTEHVGSVVPAGHIIALGDSSDSLDSRMWGAVPLDRVEGLCHSGHGKKEPADGVWVHPIGLLPTGVGRTVMTCPPRVYLDLERCLSSPKSCYVQL